MQFDCHIRDRQMVCTITVEENVDTAVLCFAAMAPVRSCAGGSTIKSVGGYTEVLLPRLVAGRAHELTLEYVQGYAPANRAWMPMGPYLRIGERRLELSSSVPQGRLQDAPGSNDGDCMGCTSTSGVSDTLLAIVPQPQRWIPDNGRVAATSVCPAGGAATDPAIIAVSELAQRRRFVPFVSDCGLPLHLTATASTADAADAEAYQLTITSAGVTIDAATCGGRFYACITLLMLMRNYRGQIPCGRIEDWPRFAWRGQHLDTARHFYQRESILDLLDVMALLKLNRFHWHFADDEAFRLELDCCPELWQRTAMRGDGHLLPGFFSATPEAGGSYSKADVAALVARASTLHIDILPEIEMPAHALAVTRVYPDTRDPDDAGTETSVQGYCNNLLNPAMPKTWELLDAMITELGSMFPFRHIHLGCDELPIGSWAGSPRVQALMRRENLHTQDDVVGWTMSRLAHRVRQLGMRPVAWEEAAIGSNGGIGHDAILFSWSAQGPGLDAARAGYDVVMCPAQHVYLDMAHSSDVDDWGASWAAFISLEDTISWDVVPDPALTDRVIGVQGEFWSEFTSDDRQIWPMLLPRILGVAAMAWQVGPPDAGSLQALARNYSPTLLHLGVHG